VGARDVKRLQLGLGGLPTGGGNGVQLQWLRLMGQDRAPSAERFSLQARGRRLTVDGLFQESDRRLETDRTVSAEDRALLGNSWGSRRRSLGVGYTLGGAGSLAASWLQLGDGKGELARRRLAWEGPGGARLALDQGRADATFARLNELPEGERAEIQQRQGQRWQDLSARFQLAPWLTTDALWSRMQAVKEDRSRDRSRQQWVLAPARGATVTWLRDATRLRGGGQAATTTLESLAIEQRLKSLTLAWGRDVTTERGGGGARRTAVQSLRLEQKLPALALAAKLERTRTDSGEGTERLALRLALPGAPARAGSPPAPLTGTVELTSLARSGGRAERTAKVDLASRLRALTALKLEGKFAGDGPHLQEQWKAEARGALSPRLGWAATLAQNYSDRSGGRRDATLTLLPAPAAKGKAPRHAFSLARSEALAPRGADGSAARTPLLQAAQWTQELSVNGAPLLLGLAQQTAGGDTRLAIAYDLRSDPRRAVQIQLSRRLGEAGKASAPLLQREALLLRPAGGWQISLARERLSLATDGGLKTGTARWLGEMGWKARRWQGSVGGGPAIGTDGRRAGVATRWSLQGEPLPGAALRVAYEGFPILPGPDGLRERLTASLQCRLDSRLTLDFQGNWQRRHGQAGSEPVWRLDVKGSF
jgi:hypothetical protein